MAKGLFPQYLLIRKVSQSLVAPPFFTLSYLYNASSGQAATSRGQFSDSGSILAHMERITKFGTQPLFMQFFCFIKRERTFIDIDG